MHVFRRLVIPFTIAAAGVAVLAGPASAHVTLHSQEATRGGKDALVAIRVPNEEDKATTSQLEVDFPADTPLIGILVQPTPGWKFDVTNTNLPKPIVTDDGTITQYVSKIVWTGGTIPVGGYQDFNIDVSTLPDVPTVTVKAIQTYSNGDIVRWIDPAPAAGQPAPDHPAPSLDLAAAPAAAASSSSPSTTLATAAAPASTASKSDSDSLAVVALIIGIVALVAAGGVFLLRRS